MCSCKVKQFYPDDLPETPTTETPAHGSSEPEASVDQDKTEKQVYMREYGLKRTAARLANNLCVRCGKCPPRDDRQTCQACADATEETSSKSHAALRKQRREKGLCTKCGRPAVAGLSSCEACQAKHNTYNRQRRAKQKANVDVAVASGLCTECQLRPIADGYCRCQECIDRGRKHVVTNKSKSICTMCGNPKEDGQLRCDSCQEKRREYDRQRDKRVKDEVFAAYGGYVCACCGDDNPAHLQLDHINGDGKEDRAKGLLGVKLYRKLRSQGYPPRFQVLCANCNWSKRIDGVCAHEAAFRSLDPLTADFKVDRNQVGEFDFSCLNETDIDDDYLLCGPEHSSRVNEDVPCEVGLAF